MPRLTIDGSDVQVPAGTSLLNAARTLGIDIPALCYLEGYAPTTSCMACLVRVRANGQDRLVPSCATVAEEGMEVESESPEIHEARRTALELLLSDHLGDCIAPCQRTCPAHMDIPRMIRQIAVGDLRSAIATVKRDIALPAVLGRICPEVCEARCRRGHVDAPLAICLLKRYVADVDLATGSPYRPNGKEHSGKRVAIVGAGPAGLAAAYYLLQDGHACTIFDDREQPGGALRYAVEQTRLPRAVLDAEIAGIERLGAAFRTRTRVGKDVSLEELKRDHDAVLVATGRPAERDVELFGLPLSECKLPIDPHTHQTSRPGVFAAGDVVHEGRRRLAIRSVANGKTAASCIAQYLAGGTIRAPHLPFTTRIAALGEEDLRRFMEGTDPARRTTPADGEAAGFRPDEARAEALRCMRCDCERSEDCKLRRYAAAYGAGAARFGATNRRFERHLQHATIVHEPGKCIACGLCIQIAQTSGESLGLTFIGRGFDVRGGVPFDRSLADALRRAAERCAAACPTGAIVRRD